MQSLTPGIAASGERLAHHGPSGGSLRASGIPCSGEEGVWRVRLSVLLKGRFVCLGAGNGKPLGNDDLSKLHIPKSILRYYKLIPVCHDRFGGVNASIESSTTFTGLRIPHQKAVKWLVEKAAAACV